MKTYATIVTIVLLLSVGIFAPRPLRVVYKTPEPAVTTQFPNRIQEVLPSVVFIKCNRWTASGVVLTEDIIATARHAVDGVDYEVTTYNGTVIKGIQAISHKDYDIGFIKVDKPILKPAKFGSIKDCVLGQSIFTVGSPYGKINFNNVTLGIISGVDRDWDLIVPRVGKKYGWQIAFTSDSATHPGNSGGPVFTMDGVVRGLLVGGFSPVLNCSMPCDLFLNDIEQIKMMFVFDKYKVEKEKQDSINYFKSVGSREDYYLAD